MRTKLKLTFIGMLIFLAMLACANPFAGGLTDADKIATTVVETLAASSVGGGDDELPDAPELPDIGEPDALRVAYVDDGDLMIWTEGIGAAEVYTGDLVTEMIFSGDGTLVVFATATDDYSFTGLWAVNTDGTNLRRLVTGAEINALAPSDAPLRTVPFHLQFVPGTHTLAFNTQLYGRPGLIIQDDLRLLDVDAGTLSTLFEVGQGGMFYYSPDGSQIAVVKLGEIDLVNADGSNRRENVLVHPGVNTSAGYQFYAVPRWHTDGGLVSVVIPSAEPMGNDPSMSVWTIPTDGSPAVLVHEFPTIATGASLSNLFANGKLLAPDLDRLAFTTGVGEMTDNIWDLRTANVDGTGEVTLTTGSLQLLSWNRSGEWIAFQEEGEMFVVNAAGGAVQPLADVLPALRMTWLDGDRFVYVSGEGVTEIFEIRISRIGEPSEVIGTAHTNIPFIAVSH